MHAKVSLQFEMGILPLEWKAMQKEVHRILVEGQIGSTRSSKHEWESLSLTNWKTILLKIIVYIYHMWLNNYNSYALFKCLYLLQM